METKQLQTGQDQQQQEGVNPMAKNNDGKVQCKVCGTMYAGTAEDSRCEPLAELCGRCEALVRALLPCAQGLDYDLHIVHNLIMAGNHEEAAAMTHLDLNKLFDDCMALADGMCTAQRVRDEQEGKEDKMTTKATLTNSFHHTEVRVVVPESGWLTASQVRRVRHALCGVPGCRCGDKLGTRGRQEWYVIDVDTRPIEYGGGRVRIERTRD